MNRIESFALQSGLQIDKPIIEKNFFPIKDEKYITVNCYPQDVAGKKYDLLQDVVDLIDPYLKKENIAIYQLGHKQTQALQRCNILLNSTSINQAAFILENSLLHFGVDGALNHIASSFSVPVVALYSGLPASACAPYFNEECPLVNLNGTTDKSSPSYNENEPTRTINNIKPETVAQNILDLLKIKHDLIFHKTLHVGKLYHLPILECVPDFTPEAAFFPQSLINLRVDYNFDPEKILHFSAGRKLGIITDQPISSKYLAPSRNSIESITYRITENSDESFVKEASTIGIKMNLITSDIDNIQDIRLKFFDWVVGLFDKKTKKDIDNHEKICDNTFFKSKKMIYSNNGQFPSKAHWKQNIAAAEGQKILDCKDFWEESEHYNIYNVE